MSRDTSFYYSFLVLPPRKRTAMIAVWDFCRAVDDAVDESELIDGVAMDLSQTRYPTFDALAGYCRRVASAVGLICVEIFGYSDPRARSYAINLGMALQLTNIVRDIAADLRRGRVYLPEEDLARFGVTAEDLAAGRVTPKRARSSSGR